MYYCYCARKKKKECRFTVIVDFGNKTRHVGFLFFGKPGRTTTHCQERLDREFKKRYSYYSEDNKAVVFDRHYYNISQNKEKVLARNVSYTNALSDSSKVTMGTWPDACPQLWDELSKANQNMSIQQQQQQQLLSAAANSKCVYLFLFFFYFFFLSSLCVYRIYDINIYPKTRIL